MKTHLNTLFVTTQNSYLAKDGATVTVRVAKQVLARVPLLNLAGIVCFGRVTCSPFLLAACAEAGIAVSLMTERGRFLAAVQGFSPGNVVLRRTQYRQADDPDATREIARTIVLGKLANCRTVLLRAARDSQDPTISDSLQATAKRLGANIHDVQHADSADQIRGLEGESATSYFGAFNDLLAADQPAFRYEKRTRRPPLDPLNSLLSFVYTLLTHDMRSACEACGLDAAVGYLHRDRPGRPSLALDLMEEFRPVLADRLVLSLINRKQVEAAGFKTLENGAVMMTDATRKTVLVAWQQRKQDEITHPFLNEKMSLGFVLHVQARLLARYLRGDLDAYPPFLWK